LRTDTDTDCETTSAATRRGLVLCSKWALRRARGDLVDDEGCSRKMFEGTSKSTRWELEEGAGMKKKMSRKKL